MKRCPAARESTLSSCTGEHAIEHALSAFHPALPHGAGLIMISKAYWSRFFGSSGDKLVAIARALGHADAQKPHDFVTALTDLQKRCNVSALRLSGYGVRPEDFGKIADNAINTMGGLFRVTHARSYARILLRLLRNAINNHR